MNIQLAGTKPKKNIYILYPILRIYIPSPINAYNKRIQYHILWVYSYQRCKVLE